MRPLERIGRALALVVVLALLAPGHARAQGAFAPGTVVSLAGTPHIWIADYSGILHWGGDTRALSNRFVNWGSRVTLTTQQIATAPRGDPWLSAGLLKDGSPIYLVKWEADQGVPKLQHIQSISDVELFGINGSNYGQFVVDRAAWEQRFGISASGLLREELASAATASSPASLPSSAPVVAAASQPAPVQTAPVASGPAYLQSSDTVRVGAGSWYRVWRLLFAGDTLAVNLSETTGHDIGVRIDGPGDRTYYNYGRLTVNYTLNFTAPASGTYYLYFDNGYSLLTSKVVQYTLTYPQR